eukprot:TRINITY_DN27708_c0_g2_i1.p1 TRINITY_DN27708_c0_g2~~TRINITY_DN27708_c0_g2_i1.p1  ORF type:complete len:113 (-),score=27.09 TRINITY_DN27708_c0_g2_i1:1-339(-)
MCIRDRYWRLRALVQDLNPELSILDGRQLVGLELLEYLAGPGANMLRRRDVLQQLWALWGACEHGQHLKALVGAALRLAVPVSYTHLRAHETVLDLVCRLLLEKKKTKASAH